MAQTAEDAALMNRLMGNKGLLELDVFNKLAAKINAMEEGPEKERQKFILAQDYEGLKDIYGADLSSAEAMLNEQMPEGKSAGGVYVAANPLEFLSSALRQGIGASGRRNSMDKLKQLSKDYSEGIQNIMFAQGNQQGASPNTAPIQTQAQKPDYRQYGYGDPVVRAGMAQLQGRDIPQHVQNSADRRSRAEAAGIDTPPPGQGPVGQLKTQALGSLTSKMPGLNKGLAQATSQALREPESPPITNGLTAPYTPRGAAISQGMTERMNPNWSEEDERKKILLGLMNRHSGGY